MNQIGAEEVSPIFVSLRRSSNTARCSFRLTHPLKNSNRLLEPVDPTALSMPRTRRTTRRGLPNSSAAARCRPPLRPSRLVPPPRGVKPLPSMIGKVVVPPFLLLLRRDLNKSRRL